MKLYFYRFNRNHYTLTFGWATNADPGKTWKGPFRTLGTMKYAARIHLNDYVMDADAESHLLWELKELRALEIEEIKTPDESGAGTDEIYLRRIKETKDPEKLLRILVEAIRDGYIGVPNPYYRDFREALISQAEKILRGKYDGKI